ncbi:MAG TPA: glycosyltransferase family 4 protein [Anaerohalosphaeraceae bacterium]|nr:glycosyltransferase family 4 protein [Phycisphaerae bacterium]HOK95667.1 glycosyltransferase family 4 protein [Anaerohalosphaeraceae bacterium]HOL31719.1 glycosyltransferase family 4 protein [Anaerohalosphaeraceae bacterium]HOM75371.1 glycosyltransferase family 4 protein [Anaerohalosphaeraceae bacterium]HPC64251.1 glycosyltransferase family 4 protein [Anaerohalosphaeraceae bacterium]
MIKAAILIERAEVKLGGAERSVSELVGELRRQGIEAVILAAKGTPCEYLHILCQDYPGRRVPLRIFEAALQAHLENHFYDIIHSTLPTAVADIYQPRGGSYREAMLRNTASYANPMQRLLKRSTHLLNYRRTQYLKAEERLCRQHNQTIIAALSHYVKSQFQKHYTLPDSRITVIPNGISLPQTLDQSEAQKIRDSILQSVPVPAGKTPILFLFAAHNPRLKGIGPLLAAMRMLRENPPSDVHPVLAAAGFSPTAYSAPNNTVFLGTHSCMNAIISACDAAVLPTFYDPCSRFVLEALALAKPVITTRFNGASERYTHLRHGFILDRPDDVHTLTYALQYFCSMEKINLARKAILDDNLRVAVSIEQHVNLLKALYRNILAEKKCQ